MIQGRQASCSRAVSGSATGECGLLPQHFHHLINVAVVMHLAYITISSAYWLFADGLDNSNYYYYDIIIIIIFIIILFIIVITIRTTAARLL